VIIRFQDIELEDFFIVKKKLEIWIDDYELKNPNVVKIKNRKIKRRQDNL